MKLYPIETGNLKLDGGAMFGVVPKVMWSKIYPADENNLCNWSMRCLLIKDENRIILIDNGIGNKQDDKWLKHYYLNGDDTLEGSLNNVGVTPEDIKIARNFRKYGSYFTRYRDSNRKGRRS